MYVGIYISNSFISIATINSDGEAILINDNTTKKENKYLTPLKIHVEDTYAYLGSSVDSLSANDKNLVIAQNFINDVANEEKVLINDSSGISWNAVSLLSIFIKKLQQDVEIYSDKSIQGAFVTLPFSLSASLNTAIEKALKFAEMPFLGVLDVGKCALAGYNISKDSSKNKQVLLYNLDYFSLSVSSIIIDEQNSMETVFFKTEAPLGEHSLIQKLNLYIRKQYKIVTKKEIRNTSKNDAHLNTTAYNIIKQYCFNTSLLIQIDVIFDGNILNLVIPKIKLKSIVMDYLKTTISFLIEQFKAHDIAIENIEDILFTGTSDLLKIIPLYFEQNKANPNLKLHCNTTDQVITKGAALIANDSIERQLQTVLNTKLDTENTKRKTSKPDNVPEAIKTIETLITSIHINAGCDM